MLPIAVTMFYGLFYVSSSERPRVCSARCFACESFRTWGNENNTHSLLDFKLN